jgi:HK97 gp10 family phage protein
MSVEFKVEVGGIEDFSRKMRRLDEATQECVQDALNQTGQEVMRRARQLAPVRTGRLMQSIYAQMIYKWVVKVGCYVPYAFFQEFGTRYISPRYFLTRALEESRMQFLTIVAVALQRAAEEASNS